MTKYNYFIIPKEIFKKKISIKVNPKKDGTYPSLNELKN